VAHTNWIWAPARSLVSTKCRRPFEAVSHAARAHRANCGSPATHPVSGLVQGSIQKLVRLTLSRNSFIICQCSHHGFQFGDALYQFVDGLAFGVGEFAVFESIEIGVRVTYYSSGDADYSRMIWNGAHHNAAGAYLDVIADADVAENFCACADDYFVADGGMALACSFSSSAESHVLIHENVVADLAGLADDDAHAVIDEEAAADCCAGVNFYSGHGAGELRDDPRQSEPAS
jgi:hypothetical protein